ncbi:MAG: hypothetical protein WEB90_08215 [Gemmatimonadota bacterium]
MFGASAALGFRRGRLSFGPEVLGLLGEPGVVALSAVTRLDLRDAERTNPYIVTGIGGYSWQGSSSAQDVLLTLLIGGGVTFGQGGRWRVEARWHPVVHNTGTSWEPTLLTMGGGRRVGW